MSYPLEGGYYHYPPIDPYYHPPVAPATNWIGYIILFFVIILIIGAIIYFFFFTGDGALIHSRWNVITNGTQTGDMESLIGSDGTYYVVRTSSPTLRINLTPPIDPIGQEFIIDNSKAGTTMTIAGANTNIMSIPAGTVATFVWTNFTFATLTATST